RQEWHVKSLMGGNRNASLITFDQDCIEYSMQSHICNTSDYNIDASLTNTRMTLLSPSNICYVHVAQKFISWLPKAMIKGILRIEMPYNIAKAHLDLKTQMSNAANVPNCASNCGVCGILREGNRMQYSRSGPGKMWFASDPCYSLGYCRTNGIRAMFCVDVLYNTFDNVIIIENDA
ncbi:14267_t:CDS:2, partial [Racocetra persica]